MSAFCNWRHWRFGVSEGRRNRERRKQGKNCDLCVVIAAVELCDRFNSHIHHPTHFAALPFQPWRRRQHGSPKYWHLPRVRTALKHFFSQSSKFSLYGNPILLLACLVGDRSPYDSCGCDWGHPDPLLMQISVFYKIFRYWEVIWKTRVGGVHSKTLFLLCKAVHLP